MVIAELAAGGASDVDSGSTFLVRDPAVAKRMRDSSIKIPLKGVTMELRTRSSWWLFLALLSGCNSATPQQAPLSEQRQYVVPSVLSDVGAKCDESGPSGCVDGVCLNVGLGQQGARVCSRPCGQEMPCPPGFACVQVYPGPDANFCVPVVLNGVDGGVN